MATIPTLTQMLKAGAHFGHKKSKWHPKMSKFIFTERGGIHIINLEETTKKLGVALEAVRTAVSQGKTIVFVATKPQAQKIIRSEAERCGMPFVTGRWIGGTITNYAIISKVIKKYNDLKHQKEQGQLDKYTKKEQLTISREIEKLGKLVGGISMLTGEPNMLFVVDVKKERTAVHEATRKHVPIVAMCDTNANVRDITYPIPVNDDAVQSIAMITGLIADAVLEGKEMGKSQKKVEEIK